MSPLFTVFTPTYNRAGVLHRVYNSLMHQTFKDFEWLIVDDGSTDNTKELVNKWQQDPKTWFPIRYIWQENKHKKAAVNRGVREARGELFLIFDSDDACVPEALERFAYHWFNIPERERKNFSGVTALCVYQDGSPVGEKFPCEVYIDSNSLEMRYRHKVKGEKWGFHRTEVMKRFLWLDDIPGHVPPSVIWSEIARYYKTRFVNEFLRVYYCDDSNGTEVQITKTRNPAKCAAGHLYWKYSTLSKDIGWFKDDPVSFILDAARLTRSYLHCSSRDRRWYWPKSKLGKFLVAVTFPVGVVWWLRDNLYLLVRSCAE